ncbi:interleukin-22 receptor subunit alpha-2-like [Polyodon spathula]|uniref:interleukin-22 receptor subunit alpha-2-like n=1 Tax=Polyodon spathula TaxID=7913 RepID=UPI001B7F4DB3|nr:interleukin-22 receptor subunit alpha-2-like [Polyodon spathula]
MVLKELLLVCLLHVCYSNAGGGPAVHKVIEPKRVEFRSLNYNNVLHWKSGKRLDIKPLYFVQYKIYGDTRWSNKTACWGINEKFCDLSKETSDNREWYYARVCAATPDVQSDWVFSQKFIPYLTTVIGPPETKLWARETSILVQLKPPHSPFKRRNGSWISMKRLHDLKYRIYITNNELDQLKHVLEGWNRTVQIENLTPRTTYCVVTEIIMVSQARKSQPSEKKCIKTL